jgi:hypothetical protein
VAQLREIIGEFFFAAPQAAPTAALSVERHRDPVAPA